MEQEKYSISGALFNRVILNLLIDIKADQMVLNKIISEELSEKYQTAFEDNQKTLMKVKEEARELLAEELYEKYGDLPDDIKDLINPQSSS